MGVETGEYPLGEEPQVGLGDVDGQDLRSLFHDGSAALERPLFFETSRARRTPTFDGVRRGRHKLVVDVRTGRRELYDLDEDPGETRDLSAERPEIVEVLVEDLRSVQTRSREAEVRSLSDEERDHLRALGYLSGDAG